MRIYNILKPVFLIMVVSVWASGCARHQASMPTPSGFLRNYDHFREADEDKGMYVYHHPTIAMEAYKKLIIAPVTVQFHEEAKGTKIKDEQREKLIAFFEEELAATLGPAYEIVDAPGEGVMIIRVAITDIVPNKVLLNLHWSTTLAGWGIGGASMEVEAVDAMSDECLLAIIDQRKGNRAKYHKGLSKWGHTKEVIKLWSGMILDHLKMFS